MCVACHEALNVAQSQESYSERAYLRQLIAQGLTRTQIKTQFVDAYGPAVLATPPASGFNLTIYILPPAIVLIGAVSLCDRAAALAPSHPGAAGGDPLARGSGPHRRRRRAARRGPRPPRLSAARGPQRPSPTSSPGALTPSSPSASAIVCRAPGRARSGTTRCSPAAPRPPCSRGRRR